MPGRQVRGEVRLSIGPHDRTDNNVLSSLKTATFVQ
jgi:hypothetical protein